MALDIRASYRVKSSTYIFLSHGKPSSHEGSFGGLVSISRRFESGISASGIVQRLLARDYDDSMACSQTNSIELFDTYRPFRRWPRARNWADKRGCPAPAVAKRTIRRLPRTECPIGSSNSNV